MKILHIKAQKIDLGDGFFVRRSLPESSCRSVGPFLFWDHFGPAVLKTGRELVVRQHPHIHLATLTYLFSGAILHRDSLGNECLITPGAVNWMTAGRGIVHSERSQLTADGKLEGIQLWMGLPVSDEETEPAFEHHPMAQIPLVAPSDGVSGHLIAGRAWNAQSPVSVYSPLFYADLELQPGANFKFPDEASWDVGFYVLSGSLRCEHSEEAEHTESEHTEFEHTDSEQSLFSVGPGELLVCQSGIRPKVTVSQHTRILAFGGEPFPEKRHMYWNFVSSRKEAIEDAKKRWKDKRFVMLSHPEETDFIPLPEDENS